MTATLNPAIGRDALPFVDPLQPDTQLTIHTYRPAAHRPDDPVVLVQHGMKRNGEIIDFDLGAHGMAATLADFIHNRSPQD